MKESWSLNASARRGSIQSCRECRRELLRGKRARRREVEGAKWFRKLWYSTHSLYNLNDTEWLAAGTLSDLEAEFGPSDPPSVALPIAWRPDEFFATPPYRTDEQDPSAGVEMWNQIAESNRRTAQWFDEYQRERAA